MMKNKLIFKNISIKTVLTLWYMFFLLIVLLLFSSLLYFQMKKVLYQEVSDLLQAEVTSINAELEAGDYPGNKQEYFMDVFHSFNNKYNLLALYNTTGELILGEAYNKIVPRELNPSSFYKIIENGDDKWAVLVRPRTDNGQLVGYILLARSLRQEEITMKNLLAIILVGIPLTLLIVSGGGYFLAYRALLPIDIISRTANEISYSNLSKRIEMGETRNDEIGRLIATLNNLLSRLDNAFRRQKQFTADASHELRTPISVIRAQVEEILDKDRARNDDYREALVTIKKQVEYMSNLIGQMLMLARADENLYKLEQEVFDLNVLIDVVSEEMERLATTKKITLKKESEIEPCKIKADQSLIARLLLNLIDNAIKYNRHGGKVKIKVTSLSRYIKIDVIDNGPGIPEEHLQNIFERFFRLDKSRSRKQGGAGLGLAICRWIVEAHQGKISVKSEVGNGTSFSVFLPANIDN